MQCSSRIPDDRPQPIDRVRSIDLTLPPAAGTDGYDSRMEARISAAERQVKFQALVADLATRCAAAQPHRIEAMIREALGDIADALGIDRCVAYLPTAGDMSTVRMACGWGRSGCRLPSDDFDALAALPWTMARARAGEPFACTTLDELPNEVDGESLRKLGAQSCAMVPIISDGERGALIVDAMLMRSFPRDTLEALWLLAAVIGQALAHRPRRDHLATATDSKGARSRAFSDRHVMYRDAITGRAEGSIASDSIAIRRVVAQVEQVAPTTATVLLLGETGVGKEVFAHAIHNLSPRQRRTMVRVSCAAIPTALIESELFGRERGAFTGALSRQIGRFEAANGSTIFLDEIGDLPLEVQVKLLRVLQERTVERLGANQSTKVDVRVIAATNKNLEQAVATNAFREDLFYRLNVFPITIPPLRERVDDINALVWTFIDEFSQAFGKNIEAISKESLAALQAYHWPGNVRELRNVIERAMIMATSPTLVVAAPSTVSKSRRTASSKLVDIQAAHITSVLASCRWRIRGSGGAAERLGLRPTTLESRMSRRGISRDTGPGPELAGFEGPSPS